MCRQTDVCLDWKIEIKCHSPLAFPDWNRMDNRETKIQAMVDMQVERNESNVWVANSTALDQLSPEMCIPGDWHFEIRSGWRFESPRVWRFERWCLTELFALVPVMLILWWHSASGFCLITFGFKNSNWVVRVIRTLHLGVLLVRFCWILAGMILGT